MTLADLLNARAAIVRDALETRDFRSDVNRTSVVIIEQLRQLADRHPEQFERLEYHDVDVALAIVFGWLLGIGINVHGTDASEHAAIVDELIAIARTAALTAAAGVAERQREVM